MVNFTYDIGTKVYFGKGQIAALPASVREYGNKVLLAYGGGSIKRNGIYDTITRLFRENGIEWVELSGIDPNPRHTTVNEGSEICRQNGVDVIVAVGGGSTIDCAKAVSFGTFYDGDAWDIVIGKAKPQKFLPVIAVLTLSATGSEMDRNGVISNLETNDKVGFAFAETRPKAAILDPEYTYSVSRYQTAAGSADILSHVLETYFTPITDGYLQDRFCESLLKTVIHYAPIAMEQPDNYEARANLMWASSWGINDMIGYGKRCAWTVHPMEHELSAFFDITHGVGLAILTPAWMDYVLSEQTVDKFVEYAANVFGITPCADKFATAKAGIEATRKFFFETLGIPSRLREVGITEESLKVMADKLNLPNGYVPLTSEDVLNIYRACY